MPSDPWKVKSSKTGEIYTFASDVTREEALRYIDHQELEPEWGEVASKALPAGVGHMKQQLGGLSRAVGEVTGLEPVTQFGTELAQRGVEEQKAATPERMTSPQEMLHSGISSTVSMAPVLGAGLAAAALTGPAVATTAGLSALGLLEGGSKYHELREPSAGAPEGFGIGRSLLQGGIHGGVEAATEAMPVSKVLKGVGARGFLKLAGDYIGRDLVGEQAATALQDLNDKLSTNPNMTFGDYLHDAWITFGSTLVSGGLQGAVIGGAAKVGEAAASRKEVELEKQVEDVLKERAKKVLAQEPEEQKPGQEPEEQFALPAPPTPDEIVQEDVLAREPENVGDLLARKAIAAQQEKLTLEDPDIQRTLEGSSEDVTKVRLASEQGQAANLAKHSEEIVHELGGTLAQVAPQLRAGEVYEMGNSQLEDGTIVPFKEAPAITRVLRSWVTEFTPNVAVLLRDDNSSSGYAGALNEKLHVISLGHQSDFTRQLDILSHEFGHMIVHRELLNTSPNIISNLYQEYLRALKAVPKQTLGEFSREWFSKGRTERFIKSFGADAPALEVLQLAKGQKGYFISFDEFLAERMARFMHDRSGFTPEARSIWQRILTQLRKFWNKNGKWARSESFEAFVREVLERRHGKPVDLEAPQHFVTPLREAFRNVDGTPDNALLAKVQSGSGPTIQHWSLPRALGKADPEMAPSIVKFNRALALGLGALQMAKLNAHVPGVPEFADAARAKMGYKNEWLRRANATVDTWIKHLPKTEAAVLSRVLYEEARRGDAARNAEQMKAAWVSTRTLDPVTGKYVYVIDPAVAKRLGLSERGAQVYSDIRVMFDDALSLMENIGVWELVRAYSESPAISDAVRHVIDNNGTFANARQVVDVMTRKSPELHKQLLTAINALHGDFELMRRKPYMPFTRYGQWAIRVRDSEGKVKFLSTYETRKDMVADLTEVRKEYPGDNVSTTYIEDLPYQLAGMPPALLDAMASRLDLDPKQLAEYREIMKDMSATSSFVRKMKKRRGIEGYTEDALRGFGDYFIRFANHTSKVRAKPLFDAALRQMRQNVIDAEKVGGEASQFARLHEWFAKTRDYILNPGNELSELKSFVSLWYLGGNVSSAAINALQVLLFTLPYLSERYGTARAAKELMRAYKDVVRAWRDPSVLNAGETAMFDKALRAGFIDESYATTVAQISEGSALLRAQAVTNMRRGMNLANHYAMLPFQKVEEFNRRVSMLGAYRLAAEGATFDEEAYAKARQTVEDTQNEYALEARPGFMRGNKSLIFQFMSYSQNAIFQMLGGDPSWKRLLLTQLAVAGLLGLPFAEDLKEIVKWLARNWFGKDFDAELEARKYLKDMGVNADLILRGLTRFPGGVDLSSRLSLGRIIPGVDAMASNENFDRSMYNAVGDVGGAGVSIMLNAFKALASDDPNTFRRAMYVMPTAVRNVMKAALAEKEGGVKSGENILAPTGPAENVALAAGFPLTEERKAREVMSFQREAAQYWIARREQLMKAWRYVQDEYAGDREAKADVMARIRKYNKEAPGISLKIMPNDLMLSSKRQKRRERDIAAGAGSNPQTRELAREISRGVD